jgi:hypothetical protein
VGGQCHTPPALPPGERYPVPIVQEAGWARGPVWTGAENLDPGGIRSPDRPALRQSLHRLRCSGPHDDTMFSVLKNDPIISKDRFYISCKVSLV